MASTDITFITTLIESFIAALPITIVLFTAINEHKKYKLRRDFDISNVEKVIFSPVIKAKCDEVDLKNIQSQYRKRIQKFTETLEKNFPKSYLQNFYNNINELRIKSSLIEMFKSHSGVYDTVENTIGLTLDGFLTAINHELLHLSSSNVEYNNDGNIILINSGFHQINTHGSIGKGLNEGYTVYLDGKYFNFKNKLASYNYYSLAQITELLELIVGQENMEKYYFSGDLYSLMIDLEQYNTRDKLFQFIQDCDFILYFYNTDNLFLKKEKIEIEENLKRIYKFLISSCYVKCFYTNDLEKKICSNDSEEAKKFAEFINKIPHIKKAGIRSYNVINDSDISNAIREIEDFIIEQKGKQVNL